nr:MAG TPA_asm: hypothetical protein [Caudoviricetes sp.]
MMRLTLSRSSSSVSHFSMSSRIAFSNASVMFISFMPSLPFTRGWLPLPYKYIIHHLDVLVNRKSKIK